jgi:hypothetical protein
MPIRKKTRVAREQQPMFSRPQNLGYRSDRRISGRLLTWQANPGVKDYSPEYRPWLGSRAVLRLRSEYAPFQCKKCGRVDQLACYQHGLPKDFVVPKPRSDLHITDEYVDIWSKRLADCVCEYAGEHVHLFELPGDPGYVVPWPKHIETIPRGAKVLQEDEDPGSVAFRAYAKPCKGCGRRSETTFWREFYTPPALPLTATGIDNDDHPRLFLLLTWIVGPQLAEAIKRCGFTNVDIRDSFDPEAKNKLKFRF